MYTPEQGLFEQVTPDQRAIIVTDLCGILEELACAVEDVCESARSVEEELNHLLYGNHRERSFARFDRRW